MTALIFVFETVDSLRHVRCQPLEMDAVPICSLGSPGLHSCIAMPVFPTQVTELISYSHGNRGQIVGLMPMLAEIRICNSRSRGPSLRDTLHW
jgi:hypothetical protein